MRWKLHLLIVRNELTSLIMSIKLKWADKLENRSRTDFKIS
jgi:hypothetical protein